MNWTLVEIVAAVAQAEGVFCEDVTVADRQWQFCRRRFAAVVIAREDGHGWNPIGRAIKRDHTTVIAAWRTCERALWTSSIRGIEIADLVERARGILTRGELDRSRIRRVGKSAEDIDACVHAILGIVSIRTDVSTEMLAGTSHAADAIWARNMAAWLVSEVLPISFARLARVIHRRADTLRRGVEVVASGALDERWLSLRDRLRCMAQHQDAVPMLQAEVEREKRAAAQRIVRRHLDGDAYTRWGYPSGMDGRGYLITQNDRFASAMRASGAQQVA